MGTGSPWTWALGEWDHSNWDDKKKSILLALLNAELCWRIFNTTPSNFYMFHSKGQAGYHGPVDTC